MCLEGSHLRCVFWRFFFTIEGLREVNVGVGGFGTHHYYCKRKRASDIVQGNGYYLNITRFGVDLRRNTYVNGFINVCIDKIASARADKNGEKIRTIG